MSKPKRARTMSSKPSPQIVASAIENDPRWQQVLKRDALADGKFFYSVSTTGIVCRPSCPSRTAKPAHIRFHDTLDEALRLGFRPCKRCHPEGMGHADAVAARIAAACRRIEAAEQVPTLAELAEEAGLSPFHFHRQFKAITGVTPKAYANALRTRKLQSALKQGARVTDAVYDAGFNAPSRMYEQAGATLGMTPSSFRQGGAQANIRFAIGQCSLGAILVAESERGLCAILLGDDPAELLSDLEARFPKAALIGADRAFEKRVAQVVGLVEDPARGHNLPLDIRGTAFQQKVWKALTRIPPGSTLTYTELASRIGSPRAIRAVASACAANALAVAIPCHRVVRADGGLAGYRWKVERKAVLLEREASAAE
jgi:AraC family transcriptional regulator, regulatory protein of adaptative response / methylated-DNA-[protein]-cysteine methyltransferase